MGMGLQRVILLAMFALTSVLLVSSLLLLKPFEEQRVLFIQQPPHMPRHQQQQQQQQEQQVDRPEHLFELPGRSHQDAAINSHKDPTDEPHSLKDSKLDKGFGKGSPLPGLCLPAYLIHIASSSSSSSSSSCADLRRVMDDDRDDDGGAAAADVDRVDDPEPDDADPDDAGAEVQEEPEAEEQEQEAKGNIPVIHSGQGALSLPRPVEKELNPKGGKPNAYVNLCVDDGYVFYTIVLFQMLAKVDARGVFAVMVHNITEENRRLFENLGIQVFNSAKIEVSLPFARGSEERDRKLFSKLRVWELEQFNKVVLLDSDMLISQNVDELFDMPEYSASPLIYPREKISFYVHRKNFFKQRFIKARAEDKVVGKYGANSGITVLKPSKTMFAEMMTVLKSVKKRLCCPSQEFLYHFFMEKDMYNPLPFKYHYRMRNLIDPELRKQLDKTYKVYHFVERAKPWLQVDPSNRTRLARKWWVYMEETAQLLAAKGYMIPMTRQKG